MNFNVGDCNLDPPAGRPTIIALEEYMTAMLASQQPMDHLLPPHLGQIPSFGINQSMAAEQEADPRKLCILGLPWDTTDEALREYFSQFGPLEVISSASVFWICAQNVCVAAPL